MRCLTSCGIPRWLPTLPDGIGIVENTTAPWGGEWTYPATGPKHCCCCCWSYPGNPEDHDAIPPKRVVLYFHGGAFVLCSPETHRNMIMRIVDFTGATVLAVDYRKPPEHRWPTAGNDCVEAYKWLLDHGYASENILFAGDSAGGGLVVEVMQLAQEANLPLPAGGILISPWVDLNDSFSGTWTSNNDYDFLPRDLAAWFADEYAGKRSLKEVSPGRASGKGFPPMMIELGSCECLYDQVIAFARKLVAAGVEVKLYVEPGMVHVFPLLFAAITNKSMDLPPQLAFHHMKEFADHVLGDADTGAIDGARRAEYFAANGLDSLPSNDSIPITNRM